MVTFSRTPVFSAESLSLANKTPKTTRLRSSSRNADWTSLLLDEMETLGTVEESWNGYATPDVKISVGLSGTLDLWALINGRWVSAVLAGSYVSVGEGGESVRLRWRNRSNIESFRVASACVPTAFLEEAADMFSRPGQRLEHRVSSSLVFNDQLIAGTVRAMLDHMANGACDLYAEHGARWLAAHLVHAHGRGFDPAGDDRNTGYLTDSRLARVLEYIRANLASQMTVTDLAAVAAISPFHFSRIFSVATGMSPRRYVMESRMQRAESLLRTTDFSLAEIASLCGYTRQNTFSHLFQRRYGSTPTAYRRNFRR
ncbi:helix-turn-helix domain-containing protein [Rhizobium lentis]|uniref:Helix-turn-helix transcriptional regulator n=1 Tax=Rhizobium lentis TaxID=1138194 RepID=A0ABS7ID67_9HYPH|nr:AraC family transcriptional regulator [Rhizobium lentis]MBX5041193.1 helix-turn-helix transcriptional regulator [Rhizobium lentis]MBX5051892.1 helix-turn-helix transcriptional regulator [Rhizobium lentis]MBX5071450.1 helix-turn-helix transcriptional regulator [Rhizobium lentis]MBX5088442.1 helix-turn-helix transcriptional regulator [Rhizobium lentis]MBX5108512.1 helix-turn-helix transcriptional regulator [Rhizobium lentis]